MDIEYLLILQQARHAAPEPLESFFCVISDMGEGPLLMALALIVYWCFDKRTGLFACICMMTGNFIAQIVKSVACVYRPWIRDARIVPAASAIRGATGYSFPSGHTVSTGTVLGSFAWLERKRRPLVSVACVLIVLLVAFSRNFLGVHTPQDVLVGLVLALVVIILVNAFFSWIERGDLEHPRHKRDIATCCVVILACLCALALLECKPYPLDYVDGELLVDPYVMLKGAYEAVGLFAGTALGWLCERRIVAFETDGLSAKTRLSRGVLGAGCTVAAYLAVDVLCKLLMPYNLAKLFAMFALAFVALFAGPLAFSKLENRIRSRAS